MKARCTNSNDKNFHRYGGRGIQVCLAWRDFVVFHDWALANGYDDNLTLDRKDNNGNYEPDNCRWATEREQARNRRSNIRYSYNGIEYCFKELCEVLNIGYSGAWKRFKKGLQPCEIFNTGNIIRIDAGQCQG